MPLSLDSGIVGFYRIDEMRIDLDLIGAQGVEHLAHVWITAMLY